MATMKPMYMLAQIVDEWIETMQRDGKPLPPPTAGQNVAARIT
jgi:predicted RNase H-like HicB family nuclease